MICVQITAWCLARLRLLRGASACLAGGIRVRHYYCYEDLHACASVCKTRMLGVCVCVVHGTVVSIARRLVVAEVE